MVVRILRDLVAIPSVSSLSNVPMVNYALSFLKPPEWDIRRFPYTDAAGTAKVNIVAITRSAKRAELALVCHTDTVPFDVDWANAVDPVIRGGKLYGRGSCDVKGYLACVLAAISASDLKRLRKPLAVVLTADEEIGCVGAKFLAKKRAVRARYTIIGEPTGLRPVRAGKGYGLAEIIVRGKEAHSAFPAEGKSAIFAAARIVTRLEGVAKKLASRKNRSFDPPYTTLNVGLIRGGTAKNIVAGECRITVEWRPVPGQDPAWAAELIREALHGFDATLQVRRSDPPFEPAATSQLSRLMESISGNRSTTVSFGTEAAHLDTRGEETVVFGPGDMTVAHKTGEFVPVAALHRCVTYLQSAIQELCY
jgi:acetylornithine deacetylase